MATFNFYLRKKESKTSIPIYLFIHWNNQRLVYPTLLKILPEEWDVEKQRPKVGADFDSSKLAEVRSEAMECFKRLNTDIKHPPTKEELKKELDIILNRETKEEPTELLSFIQMFIDESRDIKTNGTIEVYNTTVKHLMNYIAKKKLKTLEFKDINMSFYNSFKKYLKIDLLLSKNTVGKYIKTLKTFLNDATERNYNTNLEYKNKKFQSYNKPTEQIYLTEEELTAIYNLDLSNNKRLDKVRDLFIIGCYTAFRFSDFSRITTKNMIDNGKYFKFKTQKTGKTVYIPIHYRITEIIKKYNNSIPPAITNQKMNQYIKEVGKLAGIDEEIIRTEIKGNLKVEKTYKKYELITTHTARRSGATNMYKADIPTVDIMQITGHKTETAFLRYIRITAKENAERLVNNNFFIEPLKRVK